MLRKLRNIIMHLWDAFTINTRTSKSFATYTIWSMKVRSIRSRVSTLNTKTSTPIYLFFSGKHVPTVTKPMKMDEVRPLRVWIVVKLALTEINSGDMINYIPVQDHTHEQNPELRFTREWLILFRTLAVWMTGADFNHKSYPLFFLSQCLGKTVIYIP